MNHHEKLLLHYLLQNAEEAPHIQWRYSMHAGNDYHQQELMLLGKPFADATAELHRFRPDISVRKRFAIASTLLLMEKGLTIDQVLDPNAGLAKKQELANELAEVINGGEAETAAFELRIKRASATQGLALIEYGERAVNELHMMDPDSAEDFARSIAQFFDGYFDFYSQVLNLSNLWDAEHRQASYEAYRLENETVEDTIRRFTAWNARISRMKTGFTSQNLELSNLALIDDYSTSQRPDKQFGSLESIVLSNYVDSMFNRPENVAINDDPAIVTADESARRVLFPILESVLKDRFFSKLSDSARLLLATDPELKQRIRVELNAAAIANTTQEELVEIFSEKKFHNLLTVRYVVNGQEQVLNDNYPFTTEAEAEAERSFLADIEAISRQRIAAAEQQMAADLSERKNDLPGALSAYRTLIDSAPSSYTETLHFLRKFERSISLSRVNGAIDPYQSIMIGNRTARQLLNGICRINDIPYEELSAETAQTILAGIMLSSAAAGIPVTAIVASDQPTVTSLKTAGTIVYNAPAPLTNEERGSRDAVRDITRVLRSAFPENMTEEAMKQAHAEAVAKGSTTIENLQNEIFFNEREYIRNHGSLNYDATNVLLNDMRTTRENLAGKSSGIELPNQVRFSNGLTLSTDTVVLLIAKNDGLSPQTDLRTPTPDEQARIRNAQEKLSLLLQDNAAVREPYLRGLIAGNVASLVPTDTLEELPETGADLHEFTAENAVKLRAKNEILQFIAKDNVPMLLSAEANAQPQTLAAHLANTEIVTAVEEAARQYLLTGIDLNLAQHGTQSMKNLDAAVAATAKTNYYLADLKKGNAAYTQSALAAKRAEAAGFATIYSDQHPTTEDTSSVAKTHNIIADSMTTDPAEILAKTYRTQKYGRINVFISEIRNRRPELRFYDVNGVQLAEDHNMKPGDEFVMWEPNTGLNGFRINNAGDPEKTRVTFSDRVLNDKADLVEKDLGQLEEISQIEKRLGEVLRYVPAPDDRLPNQEGIANTVITPNRAFTDAFGEDAELLTSFLVINGVTDPSVVDRLTTGSSMANNNAETKAHFVLTNWISSFDRRSKGFGQALGGVRNNVNTFVGGYDAARDGAALKEKIAATCEMIADFAGGYATLAGLEHISLLRLAYDMDNLLNRHPALGAGIPEETRALLRKEASTYDLNKRVLDNNGRLARGEYRDEAERKALMLETAAATLVIDQLNADKDRFLVTERLNADPLFEDVLFYGGDTLQTVKHDLPRILRRKAPTDVERLVNITDEKRVDVLLARTAEALRTSGKFTDIVDTPSMIALNKVDEIRHSKEAKDVLTAVATTMNAEAAAKMPFKGAEVPDRTVVEDGYVTIFTEEMHTRFNTFLDNNPNSKAVYEEHRGITYGNPHRTPPEVDSLIKGLENGMAVSDRIGIMLLNDTVALEAEAFNLGRKGMEKINDAFTALKEQLYKSGAEEGERFLASTTLMQVCSEYLYKTQPNNAKEQKQHELVEELYKRAVYYRKRAEDGIGTRTTKDYIIRGAFSAGMLDYYRRTGDTLKELKKAYEGADSFWLRSSTQLNEFKASLDEALRETEAMVNSGGYAMPEDRVKVMNALNDIARRADAIRNAVGEPQGENLSRNERRVKAILDIGRDARLMADEYADRFTQENLEFAEKLAQARIPVAINPNLPTADERKAENSFYDLKTVVTFGADTPEAIRSLFERAQSSAAYCKYKNQIRSRDEGIGFDDPKFKEALLDVMICNAIRIERKTKDGGHAFEAQYISDPTATRAAFAELPEFDAFLQGVKTMPLGRHLNGGGTEALKSIVKQTNEAAALERAQLAAQNNANPVAPNPEDEIDNPFIINTNSNQGPRL